MLRLRQALVLFTLALAVTGCAHTEIPFDRTTAGDIKAVGIVQPDFPSDVTIRLAGTVGQSLGLIGGLVDLGLETDRDSHFRDIEQKENFVPASYFLDNVTAKLTAQGYKVVPIPASRRAANF